jgi:molecular chaperone GrpE
VTDSRFSPDGTAPHEADAVNTEAANDAAAPADSASAESAGAAGGGMPSAPDSSSASEAPHPDTLLAAERLNDLQRLNAEYVNYKRRVDRDRPLIQERAISDVLEALLPVMDDIQGARDHGDLSDGPFAAIADKFEGTLGRFGFERFGAVGETFDPEFHEALMHLPGADLPADATSTTIVQVLQPGYRAGNRIIRPARVAVADPS